MISRHDIAVLATGIALMLLIGACTSGQMGINEAPGSDQASITVHEDGTTQKLACAHSSVVVSGHRNVVTLTGTCGNVSVAGDNDQVSIGDTARLSVPGDYNTLTVQRVDSISLDGHHNHLKIQSGMTRSRPTISDKGEGNVIAYGSAG